MSSGKPDWYTSSVLLGKDGIQFLPVAVDSNGNIKAVLQGSSSITGDVNSTDQNTIKQIQGVDGATYRTIAVDSLGQLIAMVKAKYGEVIKDVQSDLSGNLTLNLKAQDLAEIINRQKYGAAQAVYSSSGSWVGTEQNLITVAGKGIIWGGFIRTHNIGSEQRNMIPRIYIDGDNMFNFSFASYLYYAILPQSSNILRLIQYCANTTGSRVEKASVALAEGITFESSVSLRIELGGDPYYSTQAVLFYSLI